MSSRPIVQKKATVSEPVDRHEQEADRVAHEITGTVPNDDARQRQPVLSPAEPRIQREVSSSLNEPEGGGSAGEEESSPAGLIVEDDAAEVGVGQMRKSQFLRLLEAEILGVADPILLTVGRSANSCPYVTNWIGYGQTRDSVYVETFVRRFANATEAVTAQDYISLVGQRVRIALVVWVATGEITGLPEDMATELAAASDRSDVEKVATQIANEVPSASPQNVSAQAKANDGGQATDVNPQSIQRQLGAGNSLDTRVKSRMENAFGYSFSQVRVHHDADAANLSARLNARAFTVGNDVAFGTGEYRPGNPIGDALLAHELAHVVQQGGAGSFAGMQPGSAGYNTLEEDADRSAVGAVASMWGGAKGKLKDIGAHAMPRLRSGLRLSRCPLAGCKETSTEGEKAAETKPKVADSGVPAAPPGEGWTRNATAAGQKLGVGDMEGTYYIDASSTERAQKEPPSGNPAIKKPNFVGSYFTFTDKSKGTDCSSGNGPRSWLSYKYYEEAKYAGFTTSVPSSGQWTKDISGYSTAGVDFRDFAGLLLPGTGTSGYIRRTYRVGIICPCKSDPTKAAKGFLTDYSYSLDIWFKDNDVAVRVLPGSSYGGDFQWCDIPPPGVTCVDACPTTTTPTAAPGGGTK